MSTRSDRFLVGLLAALSLSSGGCSGCAGMIGAGTPVDEGDGGATSDGPRAGDGGHDGPMVLDFAIPDDMAQGFVVQPTTALQTITVNAGQGTPVVMFTATFGGAPVNAGWSVDRTDIGTVGGALSSSATFTPTGAAGGLVTLTARTNKDMAQRQILVLLTALQNGANANVPSEQAQLPTDPTTLSAGGGVGGVGGEGLGPAVTDMPTLQALKAPTDNGQSHNLALIYPYDQTVWPRGMRAPLLMWSWSTGDADAIAISIRSTTGSFSYSGTFGRPAILATTGGPFIRHPIPQDIWDMATNTAGGTTPSGMKDQLTVSLTVAKGGQAFGPITQTYTVAPARLTGTVYYNSYGTQLVKNWTARDAAGHTVGAAILGVRSGETAPHLVVGQDSPMDGSGNPTDDSGCRVCHVVSSRGRWLLTQSEQGSPGDGRSYLYDLTSSNVQASATTLPQEGVFAWAAMLGDGSFALTNSIDPSSSNPAITNGSGGGAQSSFWQFGPAPVAAALNGLPSPVAAGYPSYSPDDKYIAYIDVTGRTNDVQGALMMGSYDPGSQTFSNLLNLLSPAPGQRIGYPVFLPDDSGVVFETEVRSSQSDSVMVTRNGARSELWWMNLGMNGQPVPLNTLNGKLPSGTYLPIGPNNHGVAGAQDAQSSYDETGFDDTTLDYEPTVLPIVAGGYAWVVFTSRRLYGNQLTAVPWQSWPPSYDITSLSQATTKKLWVAAIDLNAPAGSDPSHPAFYLPAQELLAGNSRGFWVLDPCKVDGQSCASGDQCCDGYCEPSGDGGNLVCSMAPANQCSGLQEKCTTAANCCDPTNLCINGFCAQMIIN